MELQTKNHPAVVQPQPYKKGGLLKINDFLAIKLVALYGTAITIWLFAAYSLVGAFVGSNTLSHLLYWSNAAQLVFCPASLYVGNLLKRQADAKQEADHQALTHLANVIDDIADHLGISKELPPADF